MAKGGRPWFRALRRHELVVAIGTAVEVIALVILRPSAPVSPGAAHWTTSTKVVAVLPLVNVGGESSEEYFADGLTDELIGALARNPSMRVASRTSSYAFKGAQGISSRDIGRQLEVDATVEGAVRRSGNRVRLMVELTDVVDGLVLWSRSYERELGDVFAIQQEIASGIAEALDIELFGSSLTVREAGTEDAEAHDLYLRGHFLYNKFTGRDLRVALELYGEAVRRDSGFALAHVGIAEVWEYLADDFVAPDSAHPRARVAAQVALTIDSALPAAHALLGGVATYYDWDLRTAEAQLHRALALNPGLATAHGSLADVLIATGRPDQAREEVRTAQRLDPLSLRQTLFSSETALRAGWNIEALQCARRALELDPNSAFVWDRLGDAHLAVGIPTAPWWPIDAARQPSRATNTF